MKICTPKFVALDNAILAAIARDSCCNLTTKRTKAKDLVAELLDAGVYITFSTPHLLEFVGHADTPLVLRRAAWLRTLPLVAAPRPYSGGEMGGLLDIMLHEAHAVVHGGAQTWGQIIDAVRPTIWRTSTGLNAFPDDPDYLMWLQKAAQRHLEQEQYVASAARVDAGDLYHRRLGDLTPKAELPELTPDDQAAYFDRFASDLEGRFGRNGDERISTRVAAEGLARIAANVTDVARAIGGDPYQAVYKAFGVPSQLLGDQTPMSELCEIAVYVAHLRTLSEYLRPSVELNVLDLPLDTLPSATLNRALLREQHNADRVSGSDLGDGHIAPLAFYLDATFVDKRTDDHLRKIRARNAMVNQHLRHVLRNASDYSNIPSALANAGII
jgi:hypothetical protein